MNTDFTDSTNLTATMLSGWRHVLQPTGRNKKKPRFVPLRIVSLVFQSPASYPKRHCLKIRRFCSDHYDPKQQTTYVQLDRHVRSLRYHHNIDIGYDCKYKSILKMQLRETLNQLSCKLQHLSNHGMRHFYLMYIVLDAGYHTKRSPVYPLCMELLDYTTPLTQVD